VAALAYEDVRGMAEAEASICAFMCCRRGAGSACRSASGTPVATSYTACCTWASPLLARYVSWGRQLCCLCTTTDENHHILFLRTRPTMTWFSEGRRVPHFYGVLCQALTVLVREVGEGQLDAHEEDPRLREAFNRARRLLLLPLPREGHPHTRLAARYCLTIISHC